MCGNKLNRCVLMGWIGLSNCKVWQKRERLTAMNKWKVCILNLTVIILKDHRDLYSFYCGCLLPFDIIGSHESSLENTTWFLLPIELSHKSTSWFLLPIKLSHEKTKWFLLPIELSHKSTNWFLLPIEFM